MTDERFSNIENRLDRAEALLSSAGEIILAASELARQNSEQIATLSERAGQERAELVEWRRTTQAALDKIDRLLDYLMQRNGQQGN